MNKKAIKILAALILIIVLIILVKDNVKMTKEEPIKTKESSRITSLNVGSDLVEKLYDSLNMKLVNNNCRKEDKCLVNEAYSFMYFTKEKEKVLSDDEKIYLAINQLYKEDKLENISQEDKTSYLIDKGVLDNEITTLFGETDFNTFNYTLKTDANCGVIEYTYLKDKHEINTNVCTSSYEKGLSKIEEAYKKEDKIYISVKVFKYIESDNIITIKTVDNEEIDSYEMSESSKDIAEYFEDDRIEEYDFEFELKNGNYYLQRILLK